ncbi:MAG TPA: hypothetical protein PKZ76_16155 [Xanthomonadaceae bacterium]|nr:hypothetical protein [Xanthomonadaceae bacterium]
MDSDIQLEATFQMQTRSLAVSVVGYGRVHSTPAGIDCPASCVSSFPEDIFGDGFE